MNNIAIMGGTFDPIHHGHLITATYIKEKFNFDKIVFIPCYISPLKTNFKSSNSEHRINMLKLAIEGISYFDWSDIEINNPEISYTYNTLIKLKKHFNNLNLIIGYDNYAVFDKWYNPEGIFNLATVYVLNRQDKESKFTIMHNYQSKVIFIDNPLIEISSSDIRNRVNEGKNIKFFVPEKIDEYIIKNNLYR